MLCRNFVKMFLKNLIDFSQKTVYFNRESYIKEGKWSYFSE